MDVHLDPRFRQTLGAFDLNAIAGSKDVIYFLDADLVIRGFNQAWLDFALANGGQDIPKRFPIGTPLRKGIIGDAWDFYRQAYREALDTLVTFEQEYECSSADVFRRYQQTAYPLGHGVGLYISNHLAETRPITEPGMPFTSDYIDDHGMVCQCAHCRRTRHARQLNRWDWVPALVREPYPQTSHSFCPPCFAFYYGESS